MEYNSNKSSLHDHIGIRFSELPLLRFPKVFFECKASENYKKLSHEDYCSANEYNVEENVFRNKSCHLKNYQFENESPRSPEKSYPASKGCLNNSIAFTNDTSKFKGIKSSISPIKSFTDFLEEDKVENQIEDILFTPDFCLDLKENENSDNFEEIQEEIYKFNKEVGLNSNETSIVILENEFAENDEVHEEINVEETSFDMLDCFHLHNDQLLEISKRTPSILKSQKNKMINFQNTQIFPNISQTEHPIILRTQEIYHENNSLFSKIGLLGLKENNTMSIRKSSEDDDNTLFEGFVKYFDKNKDFGFIKPDHTFDEIFFHLHDIIDPCLTKNLLILTKNGAKIKVSFRVMQYIGRYKASKKAICIVKANMFKTNVQ